MALTLYDAATPIFARGLNSLSGLIDTAVGHGVDEAAIMEARLAPDMRPFPSQIQMASDAAKGAVARLTGVAAPSMPDEEASFAELKDRIGRTLAFIESVDRSAFDGAETRDVVVKVPGHELRFHGQGYLTSFAIPNFYFHVSMAYALLRQAGVPLGKQNFLGRIEMIGGPLG
jgi:hypothetical protein